MAETLPPLTYGKVIGRFLAAVGDTASDADDYPDAVPLSGTVTITPAPKSLKIASAQPVPATIGQVPVVCTLDQDGYLSYNGEQFVYLLATDDPSVNPTDYTYTVSFDLKLGSTPVRLDPYPFHVPASGVTDLTLAAPLVESNGVLITKGDKGDPGTGGGIVSDTILRIVLSEDPNTPLVDGDLLIVVPAGTLPDSSAPTTPAGLSATAASSTAVNLSWTASTDDTGVTGYEYRVNGGTVVNAGAGITETVSGLTASTSYTFEVRAYDAAGNRSSWSTVATATTLTGSDATAPSTPTGLSAVSAGQTTVNLTWVASADNVAVTGYEYRINGGAAVDAGAGTTESVTGLTAGTTYTFEIRAYDAAGNRSGYSTTASATTDSSIPIESYTTDFAGMAAEAAPTGWTSRWTAFTTLLIKDDAATGAGKVLRTAAAASVRSAASWEGGTSTGADVEMLTRWRALVSTAGAGRVLLRGAGSAGAETAILGYLSSTGVVTLGKYVAGTATTLTAGTNIGGSSAGVWFRTRMRVVGSTVSLRIWAETDAEPTTWQATSSALTDITAAGWVGLMAFNNGQTEYDWVSVAYDGATAPTVE